MSILDAKHPLWAILRLATILLALVLILHLTASRFDDTELKTLLYAFLAFAGAEYGVGRVIKEVRKRSRRAGTVPPDDSYDESTFD